VTFGPGVELIVSQTATAVTSLTPGNTATAGTGWALETGSAYITSAITSADTVIFSWEFTTAGIGLWVTADGGLLATGATIGGQNCIYFPPTAEGTALSSGQGILENVQAIPNWNVINSVATYYDGKTKAFDQSQSVNFTAQSGMTGIHLWNTAPNWASFCPDSTSAVTGHVTVTFQ
jgi:hypothetical protein